jgi:hypothetical protein
MADLGIHIAGELLAHRLYHFVLAYSAWDHAEVVLGGESYTALACGLQTALWSRGGAPAEHRVPTASRRRSATSTRMPPQTRRYEALCAHYGMQPTRNNRGVATRTAQSKASMAISSTLSPRPCCCAATPTSIAQCLSPTGSPT